MNKQAKMESLVHRILDQILVVYRAWMSLIYGLYARLPPLTPDVGPNEKMKNVDDLPGPIGYPIIGTLPEYFRAENRGKVHEMHKRRHEKYGKFIKERLGLQTNVNLADAELVEELCRQEGRAPYRPPYEAWTEYNKSRGRRPGLITAQGDEWYHLRKSISKYLLPQRCVLNNMRSMEGVTTSFLQRLRRVRHGTSRESLIPQLSDELYRFSLESIVSVLLDSRLGCLDPELNERAQKFIKAAIDMFDTGFKMIVFARIHRWLGTSWWRTHENAWDTIRNTSRELIIEKLKDIDRIKKTDPEHLHERLTKMGVIGQLLSDSKMTLDEICTNTAELMGGGIDSISSTIGFALYFMATNPDVQERLYEEVTEVTHGKSFRLEHLQGVPLMKNILKETLRMYAVVPVNARVLQKDVILRGYRIPRGTCVLFNVYTMSRDPQYYTRPDEFVPDRWNMDQNENEKADHNTTFSSMPFGFGGRSCIGRRITETEVGMVVCSIVQNFRISPHESLVLNTRVKTFMSPGDQLNLVFEDRITT